MKKIFAAVCSMALVLGLAACGSPAAQNGADQVEGLTDEASVSRARELMEGLIASPANENMTEVDAISTSTDVNGDTYRNIITMTTMRDLTGETPRFFIETVSEPAADSDATYYINGTDGVIEVGDERESLTFDQAYIDSLVNPADTSDQYRVYYDCANQISYYGEDGIEVVMLQVDPEKLMETGLLSETFSNITGCVAEYTFDKDGHLSAFINTVEGTLIGADGTDVEGSVETKCLFTDYGTTTVPELPDVSSQDAAATEETDEEQSGE